MTAYIGVDPSTNSTGVCVRYEGMDSKYDEFYIIKPEPVKKKEAAASDALTQLFYMTFPKDDTTCEDAHEAELNKTHNFLRVKDILREILGNALKKADKVIVCQEGISYGSAARTRSVFDLAGLNYLLREASLDRSEVAVLTVAAPSEIKKFATGKGNADKDAMLAAFDAAHPDFSVVPKRDDIADAWFMSLYAEKIPKE